MNPESQEQLIQIEAGLEAIRQEKMMLEIKEEHLWERKLEILGEISIKGVEE